MSEEKDTFIEEKDTFIAKGKKRIEISQEEIDKDLEEVEQALGKKFPPYFHRFWKAMAEDFANNPDFMFKKLHEIEREDVRKRYGHLLKKKIE